jgi:hypothetical protein
MGHFADQLIDAACGAKNSSYPHALFHHPHLVSGKVQAVADAVLGRDKISELIGLRLFLVLCLERLLNLDQDLPLVVGQLMLVSRRTKYLPENHLSGALLLAGMGHGDLLSVLWGDFARGNRLCLLECLCRIEAIAAFITHPDHHVLKDDKARFVFKRFAVHPLWLNRSLAVFAPISELGCHGDHSVTS